jgi:DNA polymerase-3 subunit gamma/tau
MVLVRLAYAADLPTPDEALRSLKDSSGTVVSGSMGNGGSSPGSAARLSVAAEGSGRSHSAMKAEVAAEAVASVGPRLTSLEEIAELALSRRDLKVKHAIETQVRLVRMQEGRLEIALVSGVPAGITSELATKLSEWTGKRWFVAISDQEGAPTLAETAAAKKVAMVHDVRSDPLVAAVLSRFPGAEIVDVRQASDKNVTPQPGEVELQDANSDFYDRGEN